MIALIFVVDDVKIIFLLSCTMARMIIWYIKITQIHHKFDTLHLNFPYLPHTAHHPIILRKIIKKNCSKNNTKLLTKINSLPKTTYISATHTLPSSQKCQTYCKNRIFLSKNHFGYANPSIFT